MPSQTRHGGKRPGAGRPKTGRDPLSKVGEKYYLSPDEREYLRLWAPDGNGSAQLSELIARAQGFWPKGPSTNPTMNRRQLKQWAGK